MTPEGVTGLAVGGTALELAIVWIALSFGLDALDAADERAERAAPELIAAGRDAGEPS